MRLLREFADPVGLSVPAFFCGMTLAWMALSSLGDSGFMHPSDPLRWYFYHGLASVAAIALMAYAVAYAKARQDHDRLTRETRKQDMAIRLLAELLPDNDVGRVLHEAEMECRAGSDS